MNLKARLLRVSSSSTLVFMFGWSTYLLCCVVLTKAIDNVLSVLPHILAGFSLLVNFRSINSQSRQQRPLPHEWIGGKKMPKDFRNSIQTTTTCQNLLAYIVYLLMKCRGQGTMQQLKSFAVIKRMWEVY